MPRVDIVELGGLYQRVHHGSSFAAAIGAGEQPSLAAEYDATQFALGWVERKQNPSTFRRPDGGFRFRSTHPCDVQTTAEKGQQEVNRCHRQQLSSPDMRHRGHVNVAEKNWVRECEDQLLQSSSP
jgi:hypothetical protein